MPSQQQIADHIAALEEERDFAYRQLLKWMAIREATQHRLDEFHHQLQVMGLEP